MSALEEARLAYETAKAERDRAELYVGPSRTPQRFFKKEADAARRYLFILARIEQDQFATIAKHRKPGPPYTLASGYVPKHRALRVR